MAKKIQMMSHDKEWQMVDGVETLVPVEQFDIDPVTDSSCVKIEGFRTLEETLNEKNMFTPEVTTTKVMDKVGGEYHQNVVDGAYEEAILYGNTQVNLCEEDTSNTLTIPTTFTSFNNGELQINNKENQVVAPLIKGVTMVNLAQERSATFDVSNSYVVENVKGNTTYTVFFNFTVKNTNAGIIIQSYNGNTYLENSIHKTQLGDKVKFTFTTHSDANRFSICNPVAYGGQTIQLDDIMAIEGDQTALDIPYFKGMKSVELVRPLTNLFTDTITTYEAGATATNSSGNVTVTSKSSSSWSAISFKMNMLKNNTKYLVMWDSLNTTQTSTSNTEQLIGIYYVETSSQNMGTINNNILCPTKRSLIFDTKDFDVAKIWLKIHSTLNNTETGTTTVTGLRVFEYDDYLRSVDLQSIGYFSGTKNVAVEPIKTCSKNLYPYGDINFTPTSTGWFDAKGNSQMTGDIASKSHSRFLLKKGTYYFSIESNTNAFCQLTNDKENMGVNANSSFTLQEDTYVTLRVKVTTANTSATVTNIQIERGTTATDYVAHDSRYYEPNGQNTIVLRSLPSGVCDTFNLQTGEYTRRINEIVLDGNEEWILSTKFSSTYNSYYFVLNEAFRNNIKYVNDKYQLLSSQEDLGKNIGIYMGSSLGKIAPFITSDKMTLSEFKEYLQQNPVTVQYELATPTTTIIPRTIKRNNNGTISTIDFGTYTNKESLTLPKNPSYLTINSMTSIKPVVEPITYVDFKTRLKTNTDYSVKLDKNTDSQLSFKIGGVGTKGTYFTMNSTEKQKIAKTPTLDVSNVLRISGNGSIQNIMVIEGDVLDKELPYFNGMCNVKMPIVRNCGKNLFNINDLDSSKTSIINDREFQTTDVNLYTYINIKVKPNTTYSICFKAYKDGGNASGLVMCIHDGKNTEYYDTISRLAIIVNVPSAYDYRSTVFTTKSDYISLSSLNSVFIKDLTIIESNTVDTDYIPYRGNDICIVQGEIGLSQDMFEQGGISSYPSAGTIKTYDSCKSDSGLRIRSKALFKINGGSTYRIRFLDSDKRYQYYLWDASGNSLGITGGWSEIAKDQIQTINTPIEAKYMSLMFKKGNNNANISVSDVNLDYFQLLELDSTVQLRSLPNGVKDELNLLTGEYIQRVGELTLNGSEYWSLGSEANWKDNGDTIGFFIMFHKSKNNICISDKFSFMESLDMGTSDDEGVTISSIYTWLGIRLLKTKLNTKDVDGLKSYLQSNPITVQYELAEPIISYPRIVSNTQEREVGVKLPNGVCDTYNPSTGITIKRVGKTILDGSEDWNVDSNNFTNVYRFTLKIEDMVYKNWAETTTSKSFAKAEGFITLDLSTQAHNLDIEHLTAWDVGRIILNISKNKVAEKTLSALKTYLASNPITVWYELKNPIVTTDVVLPNGVHDEYNPLTGLYTKRVGYVEFDGSDDEVWTITIKESNAYRYVNGRVKNIKYGEILSNIPTYMDDVEFVPSLVDFGICSRNNNTGFNVHIPTTKANSDATYREYLSQNPIKVWYELETPIAYQLTPYFGLPMPYAYKDGHLIMDSAYDGVTLPPEFKYKLVANRTGQVNQNNIKLQQHTTRLSNLEAMLVEATLQSIYEREMMAFNLEMVNINLINLEE